MHPETLRKKVRQHEADSGALPDLPNRRSAIPQPSSQVIGAEQLERSLRGAGCTETRFHILKSRSYIEPYWNPGGGRRASA